MVAFFFAPESIFFLFALLGIVLIGVIEFSVRVLGASLARPLDRWSKAVTSRQDGLLPGIVHWIGLDRVSSLYLVPIFLGAFAFAGFTLQSITATLGFMVPAVPASIPAIGAAALLTRNAAESLERVLIDED